MKFANKVVLITGATKGIGRATAIRFAKEGAKLVISGRNKDGLDQVENEIRQFKAECLCVRVDVRDMTSVSQMIDAVENKFGEIHVLVKNAAIFQVRSIMNTTAKEWIEIVDTNLNGVFRVTRSALRLMIGKGKYNKIINISSQAGKSGGIQPVHSYAASKAGIIAFTFSLARELAAYNILVNCVAPGVIKTGMVLDQIEEKKKLIPLGIGSVDDVASAILFLASDEANYITGEVLDVNGGMLMD